MVSSSAMALGTEGFGLRSRTFQAPMLVPAAASVPNTLLVDRDADFVYTFQSMAGRYHVPVRSFDSVATLAADHRWDYDLMLMDLDTVGSEHIFELALELTTKHGCIPILVVGTDRPTKQQRDAWSPLISGFLPKDWGTEALLSEALQIFSVATQRTPPKPFTIHAVPREVTHEA